LLSCNNIENRTGRDGAEVTVHSSFQERAAKSNHWSLLTI